MDGEGVELGHVEGKVGLGNNSRCRPGGIADLLTKYIIPMLSLFFLNCHLLTSESFVLEARVEYINIVGAPARAWHEGEGVEGKVANSIEQKGVISASGRKLDLKVSILVVREV